MTPISSPWPFAQRRVVIMGPFPLVKKQLRILIVAIDYFTKWVEAEPVTTITVAKVKSCVKKHHLQVWNPTCHNIRQWKAI